MMAALSISRAWDESRAVLRSDGGLLAAVALALFVLPGVASDLFTPRVPQGQMPEPGLWLVFAFVSILCLLLGVLAIARLALGPKLTVGEAIGHAARRFLPLLAASILWALPFVLLFALLVAPYTADPKTMPPAVALGFLVLFLVYIFVGVRMLLLTPIAANEPLGPVAILKRSWQLTKGHWWKLFATLLLFLIMLVIVMAALGAVLGSVIVLLLGQPEPFSVSALLMSLITQIASAVLTTLLMVLLARIYVQLADAGAHASVPDAP